MKSKNSKTMERKFEYYRVHRFADESIPLLSDDSGNPDYLYDNTPIKNPELMLFRIRKPIPKKPKMADYLSSPNSVVSKRIFDTLFPLKIEGIQLLPARICGKDDEIFNQYWAIHIYNNIKCIDASQSDCIIERRNLDDVNKLILDKKVLESIPLEKRLVFRLKEDFSYQLFHVSIVEAILAVSPVGIKFTNIEEWHEGSFFEN